MRHSFRLQTNERSAFTLVELMVALLVISVMAAIALPAVRSTLQDHKLSRAAALVRSAIEEARARAIASGGGGLILDRAGTATITERCSCLQMRFAGSTQRYSGDFGLTNAEIRVSDGGTTGDFTDDVVVLAFDSALVPQLLRSARDLAAANPGGTTTLVNIGDTVLMGTARLPLRITGIVEVGSEVRVSVDREFKNQDLTSFHQKVDNFEIVRQPRPAIAMPVGMPKGTVIDLSASGFGRYGNEFSPMAIEGNYLDTAIAPFTGVTTDYDSIWIFFGARGAVDRVVLRWSNETSTELAVVGDIHLLVGRGGEIKTEPDDQLEDNDSDPLADDADDGTTPLLDRDSIWVTIKSSTGEVVTTSWSDPTDETTSLVPARPTVFDDAAQQVRMNQVIGRTRALAVESTDPGK